KYTWRNNNLIKNNLIFNRYRKVMIFDNFQDFTDEFNAIFDSFEQMNTYNHLDAYLNINKKVRYECVLLSIHPKITFNDIEILKLKLLNKSSLANHYENKNSIHIQYYLDDYSELKELDLKHLEERIMENVTEYRNELRKNFETSYYQYILCDQFRNHLANNNKLKLKDYLLTK
ncbi:hypothetical protein, partial [Streptomyces sp. NPDC057131]|uniref:hypothetical protein n=1 Tax=Streptomyces sp. NPDC057131 TaxID=3346027 RepID=UPI0036D3E284